MEWSDASMHRRAYLAGVAGSLTGLGGCLSTVPLLGKPIATISVADTERRNVEVAAKLPRSRVTTARTAKIKLTWTNPTDERINITLGRGRQMKTWYGEPAEDNLPGLELYPLGRPGSANRRGNECWVRTGEQDPEGGDRPYAEDLQPGESTSRTYTLWQIADADSCFPTGTYRFESGIRRDDGVWWRVTLDVTNTAE